MSDRLVAEETPTGSFSDRQEIEKRLEAADAELNELPAEADPALRERLQQLQAACQYHLERAEKKVTLLI